MVPLHRVSFCLHTAGAAATVPMVLIVCSAILASIGFGALWVILPQEDIVDKDGTVDWVGACLGICSLVIFNFVWKYVSHDYFNILTK
jgi:hypothetical protein